MTCFETFRYSFLRKSSSNRTISRICYKLSSLDKIFLHIYLCQKGRLRATILFSADTTHLHYSVIKIAQEYKMNWFSFSADSKMVAHWIILFAAVNTKKFRTNDHIWSADSVYLIACFYFDDVILCTMSADLGLSHAKNSNVKNLL